MLGRIVFGEITLGNFFIRIFGFSELEFVLIDVWEISSWVINIGESSSRENVPSEIF